MSVQLHPWPCCHRHDLVCFPVPPPCNSLLSIYYKQHGDTTLGLHVLPNTPYYLYFLSSPQTLHVAQQSLLLLSNNKNYLSFHQGLRTCFLCCCCSSVIVVFCSFVCFVVVLLRVHQEHLKCIYFYHHSVQNDITIFQNDRRFLPWPLLPPKPLPDPSLAFECLPTVSLRIS